MVTLHQRVNAVPACFYINLAGAVTQIATRHNELVWGRRKCNSPAVEHLAWVMHFAMPHKVDDEIFHQGYRSVLE